MNSKALRYVLVLVILTFLDITFFELSFMTFVHCYIFIVITLELLSKMGTSFPILYLILFFFYLQYIITPILTYEYLDNQAQFTMSTPEENYLDFINNVGVFFGVGLLLPLGKKLDVNKFDVLSFLNKFGKTEIANKVGVAFIIVGIISDIISPYLPGSLSFLFFLFENLRFVGAFVLLFSTHQYRYLLVALVFILFTIQIILGGLFYELFVWTFFLLMFLNFKFQIALKFKVLFFVTSFLFISIIQSTKEDFRDFIWHGAGQYQGPAVNVFFKLIVNKIASDNDQILKKEGLGDLISRLNQGWIVSMVLDYVPEKKSFENGLSLLSDLEDAFLPRFFFPEKATVGGADNQYKFTMYTGRRLIGSTTMRIGLISDGYVNFGYFWAGGLIFVMAVFYRFVLALIFKYAGKFPLLVFFIPFLFSFAIRNTDFILTINYFVKGGFLIILLSIYVRNNFK